VNLFPNTLHIAQRELLVRVRSRSFVITTIILAVIAAGVVFLPTVLDAIGVDDPPTFGVATLAEDVPIDPSETVRHVSAIATGGEPADVQEVEDVEAARDEVRADELDLLFIVERGDGGELTYELFGEVGQASAERAVIQASAEEITQQDRLARAGLSTEERQAIAAPVAVEVVAPDPEPGGPSEESFGGAFLMTWAIIILTFMAILTYGNWVAQSVAEEKSNRVMELLITAATPRQLLAGKVLGTGAAGLTQYIAILIVAAIAFLGVEPVRQLLDMGEAGSGLDLPTIEPIAVLVFSLFFLGGFLLYSTLYAATGSMVSRIEDVQQASGPLLLLAMGGYFAAITAINVPDAEWVAIASLIPFFSPYLMPIRMLVGTPPSAGEVGLALLLLVAALLVSIWIAARIYSAGVLLYGQRVGFREVMRATRVAR
jgi:ABC-2 type transport system permease protein